MTRAMRLATTTVAALALSVLASSRAPSARAQRQVRVSVMADPQIRDAMHAVLARTPEVTVVAPRRAQLALRGDVVELTRRQTPGGLEVRARVTVVISDARGGAVRAMLSGRAGARGGTDVTRLRNNALRGAVRGALRSLPQHGHALAMRGRH